MLPNLKITEHTDLPQPSSLHPLTAYKNNNIYHILTLQMAVPTEIPGPRGLPLIGNILDLQDEVPLSAVERIADAQGPIFKIRVMQRETIFVAGYELFNELCDETRFYKLTQARLSDLGGKDGIKAKGLFTAYVYFQSWRLITGSRVLDAVLQYKFDRKRLLTS